MKSQKIRATGGWTLFAVIVSIIFFTIFKDRYPETLGPLSTIVYVLIGGAGIFCIVQLIRAERQEKDERRQINNI